MNFDVFASLAHAGADVALHNVHLIDVRRADSGHELLTVEYAGGRHELIGGGRWSDQISGRSVGRWGYVVPVSRFTLDQPKGACYFRDYLDQSLRRIHEFDSADRSAFKEGRAPEIVGWRCDARPQGFRAPMGLIPGEDGRFVPDQTVAVTVRVPPEFVREATRVQMTPEELLRSFVGDLAGIQNFVASPRADGYGSNGSDERMYAEQWLDRAHGMNAIDLEALENRAMENEERQMQRDDFVSLLDDFEHYGGKVDDLFAAVQALVNAQEGRHDHG